MRRRTLDIIFSVGGLVLAGTVLVVAVLLAADGRFARTYVADQLAEQKISFKPLEALNDEEKAKECIVANAGQPLTTGKQAECYANDFIGLHLESIPNTNGMTYAELGVPQTALREQVAAAKAANAPNVADLEKQLADVSAARETLFKGETLRGLLLTTYGFSIFGERADLVATVLYVIAGLLVLLSIAGLVHAFVTPKNKKMVIPADFVEAKVVQAPAPAKRRPVKAAK